MSTENVILICGFVFVVVIVGSNLLADWMDR